MQDQDNNAREELGDEAGSSDAVGDRSTDVSTPKLQRRGDVNRCPVCGSQVDVEAYHCPACRNYFCYHCRARLLLSEKHLQCINQDCEYYGKLMCDVCDQLAEKEESPSIYAEPEDGYWPALLIIVLVVSALVWYWISFPVALFVAITSFGLGGFILQRMGLNIFGAKRMVEQQRRLTYFTCVCCGQAVKEVVENG